MSTQSQQRDEGSWEPCPAGALQQLSGRLAARRRHRQLTMVGQWTVGTTLAVILLVTGSFVVHQFSQNNFGGLACSDVKTQLVAYRAGDLDADLTERIRVHLENCPMCDQKYRDMISKPADPTEAEHAPRQRTPVLAVVAALTHAA